MPPKLSKRRQRELEELEALKANQLIEDEASEEESGHIKSAPTFAQILSQEELDESEQESDHGGGSEPRKSKKKKKKKKTTPTTAIVEYPSTPGQLSSSSALPSTTKSAKKRQKGKKSGTTMDEIDQALAELSVIYPKIQTQSSTSSTTDIGMSKLLSVSLFHLDSEGELRKFFGSKVVQANKPSSSSSSPSLSPGNTRGRRAIVFRSHLTKPKPTWWAAKQREGLSLRAYTNQEVSEKVERCGWQGAVAGDEKWWTIEYSKKYKSMTKTFIRTVLSGDPQGFWDLIGHLPWHADTLLQVAEIYRHREEWAQAVDFVDRALFTFERSLIGAFDFTSGQNRLDFDRVENRPFFLAIHRQIIDLQRRGCVRTAFEFSRLLYSLDPWSDPHGVLFHLDFLAVKAQGMNQWLLDVYDKFSSRRKNWPTTEKHDNRADPSVLPGWTYSRALAMWMVEDTRKDKDHKASSEALKEAILSFPSVVPLLADKIEAHIPGTIRAHIDFKIQVDGTYLSPSNSMLHLLSHLYAQHAYGIWKEPPHAEWFTSVLASLSLPSSNLPVTIQRQEFLRLYDQSDSLRYSVYRHVIVQESSYRRSLFSFIPKQVTESRSLACDPLPPSSALSRYDTEFFDGVEDAFESGIFGTTRTRRGQQRGANQNGLLRHIQEIFDANPGIAELFPGGAIQLANMVQNAPPEVLEDILVQLAGGGRMPGNFDEGAIDRVEEPGPAVQHVETQVEVDRGASDENENEDEDEDEEEEDTIPGIIRGLRNFIGHFWRGRDNARDGDSSGDDDAELMDHMGVD